jgi:citrate synthase
MIFDAPPVNATVKNTQRIVTELRKASPTSYMHLHPELIAAAFACSRVLGRTGQRVAQAEDNHITRLIVVCDAG